MDAFEGEEYFVFNLGPGAQFHGSGSEICAYDHDSPHTSNFCASVECLVTWSTHAQKPKFAANP